MLPDAPTAPARFPFQPRSPGTISRPITGAPLPDHHGEKSPRRIRSRAQPQRTESLQDAVVSDPVIPLPAWLDTSPGPRARSPRQCLRAVHVFAGVGPHYRKRIYDEFRRRGGQCLYLDDHRRVLLSEAIYAVEDDLEYRRPDDPQVHRMRDARNDLYDDLGWNNYPGPPHAA